MQRNRSTFCNFAHFWQPGISFHLLCPRVVDSSDYMVGSYGPKADHEYEYLTPMEEAPKGMLARGNYAIKSKFTDDDKHDHLSWEWCLAIKKDWEEWFSSRPVSFSFVPLSLCHSIPSDWIHVLIM